MLAEAFAEERVTRVIAHTLAERNASNRVLEKAGFRYDGEARERGEVVWRFSHARPAHALDEPASSSTRKPTSA